MNGTQNATSKVALASAVMKAGLLLLTVCLLICAFVDPALAWSIAARAGLVCHKVLSYGAPSLTHRGTITVVTITRVAAPAPRRLVVYVVCPTPRILIV